MYFVRGQREVVDAHGLLVERDASRSLRSVAEVKGAYRAGYRGHLPDRLDRADLVVDRHDRREIRVLHGLLQGIQVHDPARVNGH